MPPRERASGFRTSQFWTECDIGNAGERSEIDYKRPERFVPSGRAGRMVRGRMPRLRRDALGRAGAMPVRRAITRPG